MIREIREALNAIAAGIHRIIVHEEQRAMTEAELIQKVNDLGPKIDALIAKLSATPTGVSEASLDPVGTQLDSLNAKLDAALAPPATA